MSAAAKNSKREKVIVTRKFGEDTNTHKIFVGAKVIKDGKHIMEQFRVPVETEVELPVEVIAQLKGRGVPRESNGALKIVKEFSVEKV